MTKIEAIGNVIVILLAVVIGSVFLKDRFSASAPQVNEVKAGDRLIRLDGWDWAAHDRTLVLALRKGCHYCEDSTPFYQRLLTEQKRDGSSTAIVAAFPDAADAVKQVVQSEGLQVQALAGVPSEKLNVLGTPTLLLVDRSGTVLKAWPGMLSPRKELEVMKALACQNKSCS
jgi:thioredoxin-related protein